jgi:DNA polymerase (family 10)
MKNKSMPQILEEIGMLLEIKGENQFKTRAYYNAAKTLSGIDNLEDMIREKRLREIKGIGEALSKKIEEYSETGRMSYFEDLKKEIPESLLSHVLAIIKDFLLFSCSSLIESKPVQPGVQKYSVYLYIMSALKQELHYE